MRSLLMLSLSFLAPMFRRDRYAVCRKARRSRETPRALQFSGLTGCIYCDLEWIVPAQTGTVSEKEKGGNRPTPIPPAFQGNTLRQRSQEQPMWRFYCATMLFDTLQPFCASRPNPLNLKSFNCDLASQETNPLGRRPEQGAWLQSLRCRASGRHKKIYVGGCRHYGPFLGP